MKWPGVWGELRRSGPARSFPSRFVLWCSVPAGLGHWPEVTRARWRGDLGFSVTRIIRSTKPVPMLDSDGIGRRQIQETVAPSEGRAQVTFSGGVSRATLRAGGAPPCGAGMEEHRPAVLCLRGVHPARPPHRRPRHGVRARSSPSHGPGSPPPPRVHGSATQIPRPARGFGSHVSGTGPGTCIRPAPQEPRGRSVAAL